ncbi:MAG: hypothetical protein SW833_27110 [Cyanobacteriota bacterium]|nr:hypothetical protein [Cyanobacteriota bacterium]
MTIKDLILENLDRIPPDRWQEVLDFILSLRQKQEQESSDLEALEDAEDLADARIALAEDGLLSLKQVKQILGL